MTVLSCRLQSTKWSFRIQGQTSATLTYKIKTDGTIVARHAILAQAMLAAPDPLPVAYTDLGGAYVLEIQIDPQSEHSRSNFIATVTAGQLPRGTTPEFGEPEAVSNPLKRKVVFWLERISETQLVEKDRDGNAVVNSAGQTFDTPLTEERWLPVLVAQKNFANLADIEEINRDYENSVNEKVFRGWGIETVLFSGAETGPPTFENGYTFYVAQMRFIYRTEGWGKQFLNTGFKHYDRPKTNPGARLINAVDANGQPVTEPVKLALDGTRLPDDQPGTFTPEYKFKPLKDLTDLIKNPT